MGCKWRLTVTWSYQYSPPLTFHRIPTVTGGGIPVIAMLTHWGRVMHTCVSNLTIIGSDNGLSPYRRQAIIWINVETLSIRNLGTNFSEISIKILTSSFKKMGFKASSVKLWPFCLGHNVLNVFIIWLLRSELNGLRNGPITRYVKWRVAHAPGMPGTFSPPPTSNQTAS